MAVMSPVMTNGRSASAQVVPPGKVTVVSKVFGKLFRKIHASSLSVILDAIDSIAESTAGETKLRSDGGGRLSMQSPATSGSCMLPTMNNPPIAVAVSRIVGQSDAPFWFQLANRKWRLRQFCTRIGFLDFFTVPSFLPNDQPPTQHSGNYIQS